MLAREVREDVSAWQAADGSTSYPLEQSFLDVATAKKADEMSWSEIFKVFPDTPDAVAIVKVEPDRGATSIPGLSQSILKRSIRQKDRKPPSRAPSPPKPPSTTRPSLEEDPFHPATLPLTDSSKRLNEVLSPSTPSRPLKRIKEAFSPRSPAIRPDTRASHPSSPSKSKAGSQPTKDRPYTEPSRYPSPSAHHTAPLDLRTSKPLPCQPLRHPTPPTASTSSSSCHERPTTPVDLDHALVLLRNTHSTFTGALQSLESVSTSLDLERRHAASLSAEVGTLEARLAETCTALYDTRSKNDDLRQALKRERAAHALAANELRGMVTHLERRLAESQAMLNGMVGLESQVEEADKRVFEMQERLDSQQQEMARVEGDNGRLKVRLAEMDFAVESLKEGGARLRGEVERGKRRVEMLEGKGGRGGRI